MKYVINIHVYHAKLPFDILEYEIFVCVPYCISIDMFMVLNATFNNISVLLVDETRGHGENQRPAASH